LWRGWPLRSGKKSSISIRRAEYGGASATPGVMAPTVGGERTMHYCENLD
jgi:hypothetical protein